MYAARKLYALAAAAMLAGFGSFASAHTITLSGTFNGTDTFTYTASESGYGQVNYGDFFTIFDFGPGYVAPLSVPADWQVIVSASGTGVDGTEGSVNSTTEYHLHNDDSASLDNYTFQYIGTTPITLGMGTAFPINTFVLVSTIQGPIGTESSDYASRDHSNSNGFVLQDFTTEQIIVPVTATRGETVPLPAAAWGGMGLMSVLGGLRAIRRRSLAR